MDKYEFNIKVEQIKKMVNKEDFATAMKIADTIDWRRVRNANLLSTISQVYEKNGQYQESKEVLLLAFERAPIGKRFLYKLTELALKEGSIREAEDYYREFCELAPEDTRQYILRYLILKEKRASSDQLIQALERYTNAELDEKWMYELAKLYAKAGRTDACVQLCDKMILLFGVGTYVDKATELKQQYGQSNNFQRPTAQTPARNPYGGNVIQMPGVSAYSGNWQNSGSEQGTTGSGGYEADSGYGTPYGPDNRYDTGAGYGSGGSYGGDQSYGPESSYGGDQSYGSESSYGQGADYNSGTGYGTNQDYSQGTTGYGSQVSYGAENSYGSQKGYGTESGYSSQAGYGTESSYGSPESYGTGNGYGSPAGYGTEGSYGSPAGYGTESGYGSPAGYETESSYGSPVGYGTENGYGSPAGYGAENGYGTPAGYGTENSYGSPAGYGTENGYGSPAGYGTENGYGTPAGYGTENGYGSAERYGTENSYGSPEGYGAEGGYSSQAGYRTDNRYGSQEGHGADGVYGSPEGYGVEGGYGSQKDYEEYGGSVGYGSQGDPGPEAGYVPSENYGAETDYMSPDSYRTETGYGYGSQNGYGAGGGYDDAHYGNREYMPYDGEDAYDTEEPYGGAAGYGPKDDQGLWQESEEGMTRQRQAGYGHREYGYTNPHGGYPQAGPYVVDEEMMANLHQAAAEKELAAEMSRISTEEYVEPQPVSNQTRVFRGKNNIRILRPREEEEKIYYPRSYTIHHMIIEAETAREGFEMAVEELKKVHQETGVNNAVIKISGSKLSKRGVFNVSDKLSGKDLIVEEAGDLTQRDLEELQMLLERDETGMIVVLIDTPHQIAELHQQNPGFINLFKCIGSETYEEEPVQQAQDQVQEEPSAIEESPVGEPVSEPEQKPELKPELKPEQTLQEPDPEISSQPEPELKEETSSSQLDQDALGDTTPPTPQEEETTPESGDNQDGEEEPEKEAEDLPEHADGKDESMEEVRGPEETLDAPGEYEEEPYLEEEHSDEDYPDEDYPDKDYPDGDQYQEEDRFQDVAPDDEEYDESFEEEAYDDQEYEEPEPVDDDEELGIDAFADYAVQYASDIDCSITGKSLLALYERVEVMEEDGIPLTRANAEDMIEEAADKAEKPSLGGLIKGVFSSKYDKDGLLILKEEHFV